MKSVLLLIALATLVRSEHVLPARNLAHTMMLTQVYLNGHGPFRMIVDTGATASALRPEIAKRIGLKPQYRVEQVTAAGSSYVLTGRASVRVADVTDEQVELLFSPIGHAGADGVLGQSWLDRHSYLLDFRGRQVILDGPPPAEGLRLNLMEMEGRPGVTADVDGEPWQLVVDSGASTLVLFRPEVRYGKRMTLLTHNGSIEAGLGKAIVSIGGLFRGSMMAAELPGGAQRGLLPASAFRVVYADKRKALLVLVPKSAAQYSRSR